LNTRLDFLLTPGYADAAGPAAPLPDDGGGTLVAAQVEKNQSELPPAQRHIIKRPRLTRLLDEAEARVLLLVAPAGYGKTTLAREWVSGRGRRSLWFRASVASPHVASVAQAVAHAIRSIAPRAEGYAKELVSAASVAEREPGEMAELLAREVTDWPSSVWLVIDDYQALLGDSGSEEFIARFVEQAHARVVITSRERPSWVSPRDLLYGEALEIGRSVLAFTSEETAQVLRHAPREATGPIELAAGWPAVVGLAALLPNLGGATEAAVPEELYDYLAQELYGFLTDESKDHLPWLAVPSSVDRRLAELILGKELADRVVRDALAVGFIAPREQNELEIHPLARAFLNRKFHFTGKDIERARHVAGCLIERGRWDDAFKTIRQFQQTDMLPFLIRAAFDQMLSEGRLLTMAEWLDSARSQFASESSEASLVRAELTLRRGEWLLAQTLAESTVGSTADGFVEARALLCAGSAANLLDKPERARVYFARAVEIDPSRLVQRAALWGNFLASSVESGDAWRRALRQLEDARDSSPTQLIRVAQARMIGAARGGNLSDSASGGLATEPLLEHITDPLVRSGFLNSLADTLVMVGSYREAERVAARELREAERFRLVFVAPNALLSLAGAKLGQGKYTSSLALLDRAARGDETNDSFVRTNRLGLRMRVFLSLGDLTSAVRLTPELDLTARKDIVSEVSSVMGFAHAVAGLEEEVNVHLQRAQSCAWFGATRVFIAAIKAALSRDGDGAVKADAAAEFGVRVLETGHVDSAVCVFRSLPTLAASCSTHESTQALLLAARASGDRELMVAAGLPTSKPSAVQQVSARELEVLELVAQGLRNVDIAERLVISEKTVKSHLQHIYEKLGVRSRTEAAARARERGLFD